MINDLYFNENPITDLINEYDILGRKLNKFIQYVNSDWKTLRNS